MRSKTSPPEKWINEAALLSFPILNHYLGWSMQEIVRRIKIAYVLTLDEIEKIARLPQRTQEWHNVRNEQIDLSKDKIRGILVTSSVVADILKHKGDYPDRDTHYPSGKEIKFNFNINTQRGTPMEPYIRTHFRLAELYRKMTKYKTNKYKLSVEEVGIQINWNFPWLAASPDGIVHKFNPHTLRRRMHGMEMKNVASKEAGPYLRTPHAYFDQVQLTMYVTGLKKYYFICQSRTAVSVSLELFKPQYWETQMTVVKTWYWGNYWPALVLKTLDHLDTQDLTTVKWSQKNSLIEMLITEPSIKRAAPLNTNLEEEEKRHEFIEGAPLTFP
jgi:hypothetical protein